MPRALKWENNSNKAHYGEDDVWLQAEYGEKMTFHVARHFTSRGDKRLLAVVRDTFFSEDIHMLEFNSVRAAMRWCEAMVATGALE